MREKTKAGLLAIFLGGLGVHHFYLDNTIRGFIYFILSWTLIPTILGIIEGMIYLSKTEDEFNAMYKGIN